MFTYENKENCQQNLRKKSRGGKDRKGSRTLKQKNSKRPSYERVVSSRLIRQVKKQKVQKKLDYDNRAAQVDPKSKRDQDKVVREFRHQPDYKVHT